MSTISDKEFLFFTVILLLGFTITVVTLILRYLKEKRMNKDS